MRADKYLTALPHSCSCSFTCALLRVLAVRCLVPTPYHLGQPNSSRSLLWLASSNDPDSIPSSLKMLSISRLTASSISISSKMSNLMGSELYTAILSNCQTASLQLSSHVSAGGFPRCPIVSIDGGDSTALLAQWRPFHL